MGLKTPLYAKHVEAGGRMVDFGGWDMPLHYGSQIEEHHAVRRDVGAFDVSHMTIVDVVDEVDGKSGQALEFLRFLLANDAAKLREPGSALYSCMLNVAGGVVADLIVYFLDDSRYRLVVNAATRDKDLAWIEKHAAPYAVGVREQPELAMIALQGPRARELASTLFDATWRDRALALKPFAALEAEDYFVARTGYTGEDGFEVVLPADAAESFWQGLLDRGAAPCGLGARDTLRLEAGMNLYGQDMDEDVSPFEAALGWTVSLDEGRDFIGREVVEAHKREGAPRQLIGLLMEDRGVMRHGQAVRTAHGDGEILSGTFSPTLGKAIGFARVPAGDLSAGVSVDIRGRDVPVRVVKFPFVRDGKPA